MESLIHHALTTKDRLRFVFKMERTLGQRTHIWRWIRSQREGYLLREPSPWITFDAIVFIRSFLEARRRRSEAIRVFEYGSGGSTLFWLSEGADCVSVEHDRAWYEVVSVRVNGRADCRWIPPEPRESAGPSDPADPRAYASSDPAFLHCSFERYVRAIDEFPDGHFDIVLVDGRSRPACIEHAAPKIHPDGLLVLDNADRDYYTQRLGDALTYYSCRRFPGAVPVNSILSRTDVYIRRHG